MRILLPAPREVPGEQTKVTEDLLGRDGVVVRRVPVTTPVGIISALSVVPASIGPTRGAAVHGPLGSGRERGTHVSLDDAEGARLVRVRQRAVGGVTAALAELGERRGVRQRLQDGVEEAGVAEVAKPAADGRDIVVDVPSQIDGLERGERGIVRPRAHRIARRGSRRGSSLGRQRRLVACTGTRAREISRRRGSRCLLPRRESRRVACRGRRRGRRRGSFEHITFPGRVPSLPQPWRFGLAKALPERSREGPSLRGWLESPGSLGGVRAIYSTHKDTHRRFLRTDQSMVPRIRSCGAL